MNFHISNVKISVLFKSNLTNSYFVEKALSRDVVCSVKRNFIVIKDTLSLTIFKKERNLYHINVTGIKDLELVKSSVEWVIQNYCSLNHFTFLSHQLDNVTATFNIGYKVLLDQAAKLFSKCNYNVERFPGMRVKYKKNICSF